MLYAVLNIAQRPTSFSIYNKTVGSAVADVSVSFVVQAARETVAENEEDDPSHITACFDGTWQKRGHAALNGIISATSVDRGESFTYRNNEQVLFCLSHESNLPT
jgi:hypothetical protein